MRKLYYHQDDANNGTGSNLIEDLVSSLFSVISGSNAASSDVKNGLEGISGQLGNNVPFENIVAPDASNPDGSHPKAYLTILFFDERFRFVEEGSLSLRVEENPGYDDYLSFMNIRAPRNGYAFVYLSNESDEAVYFDNFQVRHNRGRIIEENHYYSFGLRIAAISSAKLGDEREGMLENDYEMQGMFSEMDADIGWNDFALRNYDPQIGRWVQQDPYQQFASPYVGMGNDPTNGIDPSGGVYFVDNMMRVSISMTSVISASTSTASIVGKTALSMTSKIGFAVKGIQLGNSVLNNGATTLAQSVWSFLSNSNSVTVKWPVYSSMEAAAYAFAEDVSMREGSNIREYSSLLYYFKTADGKTYYSYTNPMYFDGEYGKLHSPSAAKIKNAGMLPKGTFAYGYIHSHPFGHSAGGAWGPRDFNVEGAEGLRLYFLNSFGKLIARRNPPYQKPKNEIIAEGFSHPSKKSSVKPIVTDKMWDKELGVEPVGYFKNIE